MKLTYDKSLKCWCDDAGNVWVKDREPVFQLRFKLDSVIQDLKRIEKHAVMKTAPLTPVRELLSHTIDRAKKI